MTHILVEWVGEDPKQFSVCKKSDIADGELRDCARDLVGTIVSIQWKRREYSGKVLSIGDEESLEKQADDLATQEHLNEMTPLTQADTSPKEPAPRKRKRPPTRTPSVSSVPNQLTSSASRGQSQLMTTIPSPGHALSEQVEQTSSVSGTLVSSNQLARVSASTSDSPQDPDIEEDDCRPENGNVYEEKYKKLKVKYRDLKGRYKELLAERNSEEIVELTDGTGLRIQRCDLEKMKVVSSNVTVFARNLFRYFFTHDELSSHSLFGKKCNANKNGSAPLPPIDSTRRDGIINFILKDAGLEGVEVVLDKEKASKKKSLKRDITKSLSDFLREEHRKAGQGR